MKLLAADFDGTLYFQDEDPHIRVRDARAIERFRAAGNLFGMCTGRPSHGLKPFIDLEMDFYIMDTGAVIKDGKDQLLFKKTVPADLVIEIMRTHDWPFFIITADDLLIYPTRSKVPVIHTLRDPEDLRGQEILSFSVPMTSEEKAAVVLDEIKKYPQLDAFQNRADVDCVYKGCSKQSGMAFVERYFQLDHGDLAGIGDSYNDLPMLNYVDHSFTFVDSPDRVKGQCRYVVRDVAEAIAILMGES